VKPRKEAAAVKIALPGAESAGKTRLAGAPGSRAIAPWD